MTKRTKPPIEACQWTNSQCLSQAEVARHFNVSASLVDTILRGQKTCRRGTSHNIAVFLGLKLGDAVARKQSYRRTRGE